MSTKARRPAALAQIALATRKAIASRYQALTALMGRHQSGVLVTASMPRGATECEVQAHVPGETEGARGSTPQAAADALLAALEARIARRQAVAS